MTTLTIMKSEIRLELNDESICTSKSVSELCV